MLRRRIPYTAIISASLVAGGLFMLELPNTQESTPTNTMVQMDLSHTSGVHVGSTAKASVQVQTEIKPRDTLPESYTKTLSVGSGDTLMKILLNAGINRGDAHMAIEALREEFDPRYIRPGQEIQVKFQPGLHDDMPHTFEGMSLKKDFEADIHVARATNGDYEAFEKKQALKTTMHRAEGKINSSLYIAAVDAGLPVPMLMEFIYAYSFDVDFQRDIQKGDSFEVMFEKVQTEDGTRSKMGNIIYASITMSGQTYPIYRYKSSNGRVSFYNDKGHSTQKALMRTPINGARLSSSYGKRKHPILGYTKMHSGVDFAAPVGTPIYAAGDGVLEFVGRNGGYGKYMRIRHNSEFKTAYAHLSRYKKGMHKGKRVKQGDVIGYVGSTGRSTGPHLHYEIIRNNRKVNPLKVRMPAGKKLAGKELDFFMNLKKSVDRQFASLEPNHKTREVAQIQN